MRGVVVGFALSVFLVFGSGFLADRSGSAELVLVTTILAWIVATMMGRVRPELPVAPRIAALTRQRWGLVGATILSLSFGMCLGHATREDRADRIAQQQREREEEERSRTKTLAEIPDRMKDLETHIAAGEWDAAAKVHAHVKQYKPDQPGLDEAWTKIQPRIEELERERQGERRRLEEEERERDGERKRIQEQERKRREEEARTAEAKKKAEEHHAVVSAGLEHAKRILADKQLCETPKEIADAWEKIRVIQKGDPQYATARSRVRDLERCRTSAEKHLTQALREVMMKQRTDMARRLELSFLDAGFDIRANVSGRYNDRLTLTNPLMGRVMMHKMTDGGSMAEGSFLANLQQVQTS